MKKEFKLITVPYYPEVLTYGIHYLSDNRLYVVGSQNFILDGVRKEVYDKYKAQPVQFYLTSNEDIKIGDKYIVELFKIDGSSDGYHLERCNLIVEETWINNTDVIKTRHIKNCIKVVATPDQIGLRHWGSDLLPLKTGHYVDILNQEGKCEIEMEEYTQRVVMGGFRFEGDDGRGPRTSEYTTITPKFEKGQVIIHY